MTNRFIVVHGSSYVRKSGGNATTCDFSETAVGEYRASTAAIIAIANYFHEH